MKTTDTKPNQTKQWKMNGIILYFYIFLYNTIINYVYINYCSYISVSIFLLERNLFISYCGAYEVTTRTDRWYGRK